MLLQPQSWQQQRGLRAAGLLLHAQEPQVAVVGMQQRGGL
jgi:hypothetical protein